MALAFTIESGRCCVLRAENVDTDVIIPQTELATVFRSGLGAGLFARLRYRDGRTPDPGFVLNRPGNEGCRFLLAGANFGCGSSREHAAWALSEFGVRAVVAPSFGEIFHRNCVRNGLLPARVATEAHLALLELADEVDGIEAFTVDLVGRSISAGGVSVAFEIDDEDRRRLLTGADEIAETLGHRAEIEAFLAADRRARPWVHDRRWS
jgi:3-isopropylmalate/(R)-2-methylmalate dehydratase small subunit